MDMETKSKTDFLYIDKQYIFVNNSARNVYSVHCLGKSGIEGN